MTQRVDRRDAIFDVIRRALRSRGWTYRELGERLGLSESGVKKVFMNRDCSLDRLLAIAAALELEPSELLAAAENPEVEHVELGLEAQLWLLRHPEHFVWFWSLMTLRHHPREIRERLGQSVSQMRRSLDALDQVGLIRLRTDDNVDVPALFRWEDDGPLMDALHRRWGGVVIEDARERGWLRLHQLDLTPELERDLTSELQEVLETYMRRARRARPTSETHRPVRVLLGVAHGAFDPQDIEP